MVLSGECWRDYAGRDPLEKLKEWRDARTKLFITWEGQPVNLGLEAGDWQIASVKENWGNFFYQVPRKLSWEVNLIWNKRGVGGIPAPVKVPEEEAVAFGPLPIPSNVTLVPAVGGAGFYTGRLRLSWSYTDDNVDSFYYWYAREGDAPIQQYEIPAPDPLTNLTTTLLFRDADNSPIYAELVKLTIWADSRNPRQSKSRDVDAPATYLPKPITITLATYQTGNTQSSIKPALTWPPQDDVTAIPGDWEYRVWDTAEDAPETWRNGNSLFRDGVAVLIEDLQVAEPITRPPVYVDLTSGSSYFFVLRYVSTANRLVVAYNALLTFTAP